MLENAYCGWTKLNNHSDHDPDLDCSYDEEAEKNKLQEMLQENFKRLDIFFTGITSMKRIPTDCFGDLRRASEQIKLKYKKLKALQRTKQSLESKIMLLEAIRTDAQEGVTVMTTRLQYIRTNVVHTEAYNTICDASECFSNCHAPCIYTGMFSKNVKECRCIKKNHCTSCGHHYTEHHHYQFKFKEEEIEFRSDLQRRLAEARTKEERSVTLLSEQEYQLNDLRYTATQIALKSEIAILLAEFQRISSKSSYEKIIDQQLKRFSKFVDNILSISKKDLMDYLGLAGFRED